ncbi:MAG: hypothetical protein V2B18_11855 [Pseudomonadota bacterium]
MRTLEEIDTLIAEAEKELARLDSGRMAILEHIEALRREKGSLSVQRALSSDGHVPALVTILSSSEDKIALFMSLFKGRQDVYPRRFESTRTGKSGYQPVCGNEWLSFIGDGFSTDGLPEYGSFSALRQRR